MASEGDDTAISGYFGRLDVWTFGRLDVGTFGRWD